MDPRPACVPTQSHMAFQVSRFSTSEGLQKRESERQKTSYRGLWGLKSHPPWERHLCYFAQKAPYLLEWPGPQISPLGTPTLKLERAMKLGSPHSCMQPPALGHTRLGVQEKREWREAGPWGQRVPHCSHPLGAESPSKQGLRPCALIALAAQIRAAACRLAY